MQFGHKGKRDRWIDYRVFKRRPKNGSKHGEFVANKRGSHLFLGSPCLLRAMTEEVPRKRSRVNGGNSSNVEEEWSKKELKLTVLVQSPGGRGYSLVWAIYDDEDDDEGLYFFTR